MVQAGILLKKLSSKISPLLSMFDLLVEVSSCVFSQVVWRKWKLAQRSILPYRRATWWSTHLSWWGLLNNSLIITIVCFYAITMLELIFSCPILDHIFLAYQLHIYFYVDPLAADRDSMKPPVGFFSSVVSGIFFMKTFVYLFGQNILFVNSVYFHNFHYRN